jgi:hypothetical protein
MLAEQAPEAAKARDLISDVACDVKGARRGRGKANIGPSWAGVRNGLMWTGRLRLRQSAFPGGKLPGGGERCGLHIQLERKWGAERGAEALRGLQGKGF